MSPPLRPKHGTPQTANSTGSDLPSPATGEIALTAEHLTNIAVGECQQLKLAGSSGVLLELQTDGVPGDLRGSPIDGWILKAGAEAPHRFERIGNAVNAAFNSLQTYAQIASAVRARLAKMT